MTDTTTSETTTTAPTEAGGDGGEAATETTALGGAQQRAEGEGEQKVAEPEPEAEAAADTDKPGEGEGGEQDAAASEVPEAYELTVEGMEIDADLLAEATPVMKELGLTNDAANKLAPLMGKAVEKAQAATFASLEAAGQQQKKAWLDAAKADEEIGGQKWDDSVHHSAKALDAFGFTEGHPFREALDNTGFGNHPDLIRALARVGRDMISEDGDFVRPDAGAKVETTAAERLYPNDVKN